MSSYSVPEKIKPNRVPREPLGLKAESSLNRITFDRSSHNPGETIRVIIPKLSDDVVIVPGSVKLIFDLNVSGHANNTVVNNISRNLVKRLKVLFGGETLQDTNRYDLFQTYHDLFLETEDREDRLRQGISSLNMRKLRTEAGDKVESDAKEVALSKVHGKRYEIPLDHPVISDNGSLYPSALTHDLTFEITLPKVNDIVNHDKSEEKKTPPNYKLENIELEYHCIKSEDLAREAMATYQTGKGFYYENVHHLENFPISKPNDSIINKKVDTSRRSMTGILLLFEDSYDTKRDSEKFVNPDIRSVNININGMPNQLYSKGMIHSDFWEAIKRRMGGSGSVKEKDFYAGDKFGLWIDLRTFFDNSIHGGGLRNTKDGVKLEIKRKTGGSGNITCHMFLVADAVMEIMSKDLKSIVY